MDPTVRKEELVLLLGHIIKVLKQNLLLLEESCV